MLCWYSCCHSQHSVTEMTLIFSHWGQIFTSRLSRLDTPVRVIAYLPRYTCRPQQGLETPKVRGVPASTINNIRLKRTTESHQSGCKVHLRTATGSQKRFHMEGGQLISSTGFFTNVFLFPFCFLTCWLHLSERSGCGCNIGSVVGKHRWIH